MFCHTWETVRMSAESAVLLKLILPVDALSKVRKIKFFNLTQFEKFVRSRLCNLLGPDTTHTTHAAFDQKAQYLPHQNNSGRCSVLPETDISALSTRTPEFELFLAVCPETFL